MNCTNCHLDAGTRDFGNNYKAVFSNYPKFRERSGKMETLEKRINDCFQRSLNGDSLRIKSPELAAICLQCHGADGEGQLTKYKDNTHFIYPPLWGENSYNTSAGLNRIQKLSGFINDNMANKLATHEKPILTEEAWNVAAYIIS